MGNRKLMVRLILLMIIWSIMIFMIRHATGLLNNFFIFWIGLTLSFGVFWITHFHYKKWGPEIREELDKLNFKLISERNLTLFESAQFSDTLFLIEIVSMNFKRIVEVEAEDGNKTLCIRIKKNYLTNSVQVFILGNI